MKCIARSVNLKNILLVITLTFLNLDLYGRGAIGEMLDNDHIDEIDFETFLNQNSVQFHEYEKPETLFNDFFGLGDPQNDSSFNTNFQDLSLQIDSKNLREIYKKKLLDMTKTIKKNEDEKSNWSFFNKKI